MMTAEVCADCQEAGEEIKSCESLDEFVVFQE